MKPRLLDLFCGAGGAGEGYARAGFDVTGVDLAPQPNYPHRFIQYDALELLDLMIAGPARWTGYDAVHASPPCQRFSAMTNCRPGLAEEYPDFVGATRYALERTGLPYVIENVVGAPLLDPISLCGQMFDLPLYRHRVFESNFPLSAPTHPEHTIPASRAGHWEPGTIMSVAGHVSPIAVAREAMGIDWCNRAELAEAIPPAYAEHIGRQLLAAL